MSRPAGPAARAGLQPGDLVLALDGKRMENGRQLRINLYTRGVSDTVVLDVQRGDRKLSLRVPVGERDSDVGRLKDLVGATGADQSAGRARAQPHARRSPSCCPIFAARKAWSSPASRNWCPYSQQGRLQPGDVIYSLNGKVIETTADLNTATSTFKPGTAAVLQIERSGTLMYLAFRVER